MRCTQKNRHRGRILQGALLVERHRLGFYISRTGTQYQFPESIQWENLAQGAPFEMRDPPGRRVQFIGDARRNLRELVSPNGRTISLEYNTEGFVQQAKNDEGRIIHYSYDSDTRLTSVQDNKGPGFRYLYAADYRDKMLAVEDENGGVLLRNSYDAYGRVSGNFGGWLGIPVSVSTGPARASQLQTTITSRIIRT